jgi:ABC-type multidrug transport system ATPase subunit
MEEIARSVDRILLLENGTVVMDATPAQVFSETERLKSLGLKPTKASLVTARLQALGLPIEQGIYTAEQLRRALIKLKVEGGGKRA